MTRLEGSRDLASLSLPPGRGYQAEAVDDFRSQAVALVAELESRVAQMNEAVESLRTELGTQDSGPSLSEMLRTADPAIVKDQATMAAGEILALAVDAADRHRARANSELRGARLQTIGLLQEVADLAREGRRPAYEMHRLVLAVSTLITRLEAEQS